MLYTCLHLSLAEHAGLQPELLLLVEAVGAVAGLLSVAELVAELTHSYWSFVLYTC